VSLHRNLGVPQSPLRYFTVRLAAVLCVKSASVPLNVSVNVPWLTLFEVNKVILAVAESGGILSVIDSITTPAPRPE
jgi:hypothetical protein